jgi:hypothetical protein
MNPRLALIRQQRAMLKARAAVQRLDLTQQVTALSGPLQIADIGYRVVRTLRRHPFMLVGSLITMLVAPRPRSTMWIGRLLAVWEIVQLVRRSWQAARPTGAASAPEDEKTATSGKPA